MCWGNASLHIQALQLSPCINSLGPEITGIHPMQRGCNSLKKPVLNTDMSYHPFYDAFQGSVFGVFVLTTYTHGGWSHPSSWLQSRQMLATPECLTPDSWSGLGCWTAFQTPFNTSTSTTCSSQPAPPHSVTSSLQKLGPKALPASLTPFFPWHKFCQQTFGKVWSLLSVPQPPLTTALPAPD